MFMISKSVRPVKAPVTDFALERLFVSVHALVSRQVIFAGARKSTLVARKRLANHRVLFQLLGGLKRHPAHGT